MYEYPSNFCLNLIPKPAGEPVFLVFSEHITSWYNDDDECDKEYTQVEVTYPRWKFLPQSSINYIIQAAKFWHLLRRKKVSKAWHCKANQTQPTRTHPRRRNRPSPALPRNLPFPLAPPSQSKPQAKVWNCSEGNPCSSQEERQERLGCNNPQCRQQGRSHRAQAGLA